MTDVSARYALPFLQTGQAQKEVTHNSAIDRIDALLHLGVASRGQATPPVSPAAGASWIVPEGAVDAWADRAGQVATASDGGWIYAAPRDGCVAWVADETVFAVHYAGAWHADGWPAAGLRINGRTILAATGSAIAAPTGGTTVDTEARAAISAIMVALRQLGLIAD